MIAKLKKTWTSIKKNEKQGLYKIDKNEEHCLKVNNTDSICQVEIHN